MNLLNMLNVKKNKGFTLIELVIVLAIFFIIVGGAASIFVTMLQQQRRILSEQELLSQTSYAAEYMSKALRMAAPDPTGSCLGATGLVYLLVNYNGNSLQPCSGAQVCTGVEFVNQSDSNACQAFYLDASGSVALLKEKRNNASGLSIISNKFTMKNVQFVLNGDKTIHVAAKGDSTQPRVTVLLDILNPAQTGNNQEKIMQTTVSQRDLNK